MLQPKHQCWRNITTRRWKQLVKVETPGGLIPGGTPRGSEILNDKLIPEGRRQNEKLLKGWKTDTLMYDIQESDGKENEKEVPMVDTEKEYRQEGSGYKEMEDIRKLINNCSKK